MINIKNCFLAFTFFICAVSALGQNLKNNLKPDWVDILHNEFQQPYFTQLEKFLKSERLVKNIFPAEDQTFAAFNKVDYQNIKVVIIGQDPYQTVDKKTNIPYGHGLSFSISPGIEKIPPSLNNIFKKIKKEYPEAQLKSGDLSNWADQGVLLLNAILTVEKDKAGSHSQKPSKNANWEMFTNSVIDSIAKNKKNVVFLLWGKYAISKKHLISKYSQNEHLIIESQHPSPLTTSKPSFINGPEIFKKTNDFLIQKNLDSIDWNTF